MVTYGQAVEKSQLDTLAHLANLALPGNSFAFGSSGWRAELQRIRSAALNRYNLLQIRDQYCVSGPWPVVQSNTPLTINSTAFGSLIDDVNFYTTNASARGTLRCSFQIGNIRYRVRNEEAYFPVKFRFTSSVAGTLSVTLNVRHFLHATNKRPTVTPSYSWMTESYYQTTAYSVFELAISFPVVVGENSIEFEIGNCVPLINDLYYPFDAIYPGWLASDFLGYDANPTFTSNAMPVIESDGLCRSPVYRIPFAGGFKFWAFNQSGYPDTEAVQRNTANVFTSTHTGYWVAKTLPVSTIATNPLAATNGYRVYSERHERYQTLTHFLLSPFTNLPSPYPIDADYTGQATMFGGTAPRYASQYRIHCYPVRNYDAGDYTPLATDGVGRFDSGALNGGVIFRVHVKRKATSGSPVVIGCWRSSTWHELATITIPDGQRSADYTTRIVVMDDAPLSYRCETPVEVSAMYCGRLELGIANFLSATVANPILADHYNDTETVLRLIAGL